MNPPYFNNAPDEHEAAKPYQTDGSVQSRPSQPGSASPLGRIHPELAAGEVEILKVSGKSRPSSVAGAIAGVMRQAGRVEIQAIGAGATNQAIKAVAIARGYLISGGMDIFCIPAFIDIIIEGEDRTAIKLVVYRRDSLLQAPQ